MEVRAVAKFVRVQPRKVRIVADQVRGKNAVYSTHLLSYHSSKGARVLKKVLESAIANAENNHGLNPETLRIATIMVDEGPRLKRIQARAMGRAYRIVKKSSHVTVVVEEAEAPVKVKPTGTKPKPRPTFAEPRRKQRAKAEKAVEETKPAEEAVEPKAEDQTAPETTAEVEASAEAAEAPTESAEGDAADKKETE